MINTEKEQQIVRTNSELRVGVGQIKSNPTKLKENFEGIAQTINEAEERGLDLLVFPELTIPGYLSLDHFTESSYIDQNMLLLNKLAEETVGKEVVVIVGFADRAENSTGKEVLYNAAAVLHDGKVIDIVHKTLLPEYDVFWEGRYFKSGQERHVVEVRGVRLGIGICEDLWDGQYDTKVYDELAAQGADILINLSASPFQAGKTSVRMDLVKDVVEKHKIPFVYANLVGGQDGYEGEIVFDGRSLIVGKDGKLKGIGKGFEEDLLVVDLPGLADITLPPINRVHETFDALVLGLRDYFARTNHQRAYIGLSGGIDSAVTAAILVEALGAENVIGVTLPSTITSNETKSDALKLAENLGIRCDIWEIGAEYDTWEAKALRNIPAATGKEINSVTRENVQARIRGRNLMSYTNTDFAGLVVTTGNKTELALGYCTLYGDMCAGINPLGDVSKLMVYDLARYFNERKGHEVIPNSTIERPPTAELAPGQSDERGLGAPYSVLSPLVDEIVEYRTPRAELATRYPSELVDATIKRIQRNEHKRRQAAPAIRVTGKAFGGGRRVPIDSSYYP